MTFYGKIKFAPLWDKGEKLKIIFIDMYLGFMAETYNVLIKVVKRFSFDQTFVPPTPVHPLPPPPLPTHTHLQGLSALAFGLYTGIKS